MSDQTTPSPTTENGDMPEEVRDAVAVARQWHTASDFAVRWFADRLDERDREIARLRTGPRSAGGVRKGWLNQWKIDHAGLMAEIADLHAQLEQTKRDTARPWMQTMGLSRLATHEPELGEVLISIGSPGERLPDESVCYADVLRVEFDDDQFEGWEKRRRNLKGMDAGRIARFVLQHRNTAPRLTIHCTAGASRSVSIAEGLAAALDIPHPRSVILNYGAYFGVYDAARRITSEQSRIAASLPTPKRGDKSE